MGAGLAAAPKASRKALETKDLQPEWLNLKPKAFGLRIRRQEIETTSGKPK